MTIQEIQKLLDDLKTGAVAKEQVSFALDVLDDTWETLQASNLTEVPQEEQITLDAFVWEKVRSTIEYTRMILKGETHRGG